MDISITIGLGICTLILTLFGILASVKPPKTRKGSRNILICSVIFGLIGLFLVIFQSIRASQQQKALEQAITRQNNLYDENQKILKQSLDDMNAQLSLVNSSSEIDLKKRAIILARDILQFAYESQRDDPSKTDWNSGLDFNAKVVRSLAYSDQRRNEFLQRFALRYETVVKEMKERGVNTGSLFNDVQVTATNTLGMQSDAIQLQVLASQINK